MHLTENKFTLLALSDVYDLHSLASFGPLGMEFKSSVNVPVKENSSTYIHMKIKAQPKPEVLAI